MSTIEKARTKRKVTTARAVKETMATYAARNGAGRKPAVKRREIGEYLVIDPEICRGELTFKGTRIPVETILVLLRKGYSLDMLLEDYPQLPRDAIREAIGLATDSLLTRYGAFRPSIP